MDFKPISEIKNRREFEEAFQAAMSGAHENLRALWHFEKEQNLPKSYLIEFHPKASECLNHEWTTETVFSALRKSGQQFGAFVKKTDDETLFYLAHTDPKHSAEFVVDCLDPRFLVFHTLSNATSSDRFVLERLTQYRPEFDLFWFPVSFLENVGTREFVTGWEAEYDPLIDAEDIAEQGNHLELPMEQYEDVNELDFEPPARTLRRPRIRFHLEDPQALDRYRKLMSAPDILPDIPLNAILAERVDEQVSTYARARIKSNGKVTGRGPDFPAYLQIVNRTLDNYAETVRQLEAKYWLRVDAQYDGDSFGVTLSGSPFCITFNRNIDIKNLINLMFNCKRPFRLMGEPRQITDNYFSVNAIDLHVNQPVGFEIAPMLMRVYLYEGTCGNTLTRIIRSLQHYIDSKLKHPPLTAG